jgi:tRNA threonylcarbamoyladenosine biosynthesis protein TsaB
MSTAYTLALESATARGSVAVLHGKEVVSSREVFMRADDEERLMPAVAACCDEAAVAPRELARVVCGEGPGSFTSLRIAASIAKGVAVAADCPLFAVSSLLLSVASAAPEIARGRYLSVLDAQRGELFALGVELGADGRLSAAGEIEIFAASELEHRARLAGARVAGVEQEVNTWPRATGLASLLQGVLREGPVDLVSWEPVYGRAPEAQVRWEKAHGRELSTKGG